MDRFADDGKLGQGFTSADDLVEVDIGSGEPRPTFISAKSNSNSLAKAFAILIFLTKHEKPWSNSLAIHLAKFTHLASFG